MMLSLEQGKQNLWLGTEGHWTKWVSSRRSWQIVQHKGPLLAMGESGTLCVCTGSMPPEDCEEEDSPRSPLREERRLWLDTEAGDTGLLLLCLEEEVVE